MEGETKEGKSTPLLVEALQMSKRRETHELVWVKRCVGEERLPWRYHGKFFFQCSIEPCELWAPCLSASCDIAFLVRYILARLLIGLTFNSQYYISCPLPPKPVVSGYECRRVFPAGVGPGSPPRHAANWLPSRFGLSVETRRQYGWLRMVFSGVRLFRAPIWWPSREGGGTREAGSTVAESLVVLYQVGTHQIRRRRRAARSLTILKYGVKYSTESCKIMKACW